MIWSPCLRPKYVYVALLRLLFALSDPTSQLGLTGATDSHWAGYNSSYAAASYAAASSFAYGSGSSAAGADVAGQHAGLSDPSASAAGTSATPSQLPTGKILDSSLIMHDLFLGCHTASVIYS